MSEFIRDEQARRAQEEGLRRERQRERDQIDAMRERQRARDEMQRREELESMRRMADVVNDPAIMVDAEMVKAINDPNMVMTSNGELARVTRRGLGTGRFASQFSTNMGFELPRQTKKKRRKNPKLAAAFREANARYRTKSGKLRKGRTQADIARLAHRLLKRM